MKIFLIAVIFILSGCATVMPGSFPEVPKQLMQKAKPLEPIQLQDRDSVALSEFLSIVVRNYSVCNENAVKYTAWQEWYKEQQELHNKSNLRIK